MEQQHTSSRFCQFYFPTLPKGDVGFLSLWVYREEALRGFLLLQFLSLIVFARLKQELGDAF
ncbi:MAG: hypothetical protein FWE56_05925 [Candidatus Bathyarchaeota archaeon]|nr:hypothetical protein [Candidatus Termiticorpusculum sp.]